MKKKRKVTKKTNEQENQLIFMRLSERTRCIHELEGLIKDIELYDFIESDSANNKKDDELEDIVIGVRWAISKLKGEKLSDIYE
jgi:hypothetical protein